MQPPHVRTFHPRRGRMGTRAQDALVRLADQFVVTVPDGPGPELPVGELFGRAAPLVLEIGSGLADPGRDYLAVEVHTPGIAVLLIAVEQRGLGNIRVVRGDALQVLRYRVGPAALAAIHAFFPDPWPKVRHHKRRLIQPAHTGLLASRLVPGGILHCATDRPDRGH